MKRGLRSLRAKARAARGWSTGLFIAGVAALGAGLLVGGIVAAATGSAAGLTVAAVIAGGGVATGGLSLWESRRFDRRAKQIERTLSEQRLFALAQEQGGTLRVVDVARRLRMTSKAAEALLDSLVDELRVSMQVTDEGTIDYVFHEVALVSGPRVRVALSGADAVEEEVGMEESQNKQLIE